MARCLRKRISMEWLHQSVQRLAANLRSIPERADSRPTRPGTPRGFLSRNRLP
jgi:hypothetical protein